MSRLTQVKFERLICSYHQQHLNDLKLAAPTFEEAGFVTTATMAGSGGQVEMRCGPAEYHTEIFINTSHDHKRWSLAELMGIEIVRNWMLQNRPDTSGKTKLEAEVEYAFLLMTSVLCRDERFNWICGSS